MLFGRNRRFVQITKINIILLLIYLLYIYYIYIYLFKMYLFLNVLFLKILLFYPFVRLIVLHLLLFLAK